MKKNWGRLFGVIFLFVVISVCWSAAYLLTPYVYRSTGVQPSDYTKQLINVLLCFFLLGNIMFIVGRRSNPKRMNFFHMVTDAIRRISKGDFDVKLNMQIEKHHPLGELANSINQMAVELSQLERMRQEFISNVSHEFQSPLTSISGFAQAMQNDELTAEERHHYLTIIETESRRLSKLSDNLLKLTSLESENHPFERKSFRLDKQLRNIVLACEPQWREKELEMDVSLDEVDIVADEDLLSQVWVNLINNSIKFTQQGGTIGIHVEKREQQVVVRISDSGIGISEEHLEHVFERFFKSDKSRSRVNSGSGLGLSIVKKIVDMHHGCVEVKSKQGEATEFIVLLPIGYEDEIPSNRI